MENTLLHEIAALAQKVGILDERKYRDLCIREEFEKLKRECVKTEDAEIILAEKFSNKFTDLKPETIHGIIYRR